MTQIRVVEAELSEKEHQEAVIDLIDAYARDPFGNGEPLSEEVKQALIPGLRRHPTTLVFLAFDGSDAVGIAVCFIGFSTFCAKPLINLHDFSVSPSHRGQGAGRALLTAVEQKAAALGCCRLTLEVLENNHRAQGIYAAAGFTQNVYQEAAGGCLFLTKAL